MLTDLPVAEVEAKLRANRRFVWLKRSLTPHEQYRVNALGIPGLHFMDEWKRIYPQSSLMAHVVGFTDIDDRGISGVERSFDEVLRDGRELSLARRALALRAPVPATALAGLATALQSQGGGNASTINAKPIL